MWIWAQRAAIAALFAFAVYVRADGLAKPNYWYDEAITSLRVAGHTETEVAAFADAHAAFAIGELGRFVSVDSSTSMEDTIHSLAAEDSQHTPLYYVMAHLWAHGFGSAIEASRLLAALWSLFALGAMYWLCLELFVKSGAFESRLVCWMGVLAMSLSPYQVAIAREHREYSLWVLTLTLACATFLRAVRVNTSLAWFWCAVAMTASLYTHLLSGLAFAACGLFLLIKERFRFTRAVWSFGAALAATGLAILPWIVILLKGRATAQSSLSWVQSFSQGPFQFRFSLDPAIHVADLSLWELLKLIQQLPGFRVTVLLTEITPLFLLVALWKFATGPRRACAGFATALIGSISLVLFLFDFVTGSTSGWAYRYAVPSNLGWLLALTFLLAVLVQDLG